MDSKTLFEKIEDSKDFKACIESNPEVVNIRESNDDATLLHYAVYRSKPDTVRILIEAGADVSARDSKQRTPLHHVRDCVSARVLIAAGAEVNALDDAGWTPLDNVVLGHRGNDIASLLKAHGARRERTDDNGTTLHSM